MSKLKKLESWQSSQLILLLLIRSFFNTASLTLFDLRTNNVLIKKYANRLPVDIQLGTSFIDDKDDKLYI